jgi:putative polyhydroxyalkanoate system protein
MAMSEITIRRRHRLPLERARELAERVAAGLRERFGLHYEWNHNALHFRRDGVQGTLTVARREIRIDAQLSFLLSLAQPRIENEILSQLDRMFGGQDRHIAAAPRPGKRS